MVYDFENGKTYVKLNDKWFYINKKGNKINV